MVKKITPKEQDKLLKTLRDRFEKNMNRHKGVEWEKVQKKLRSNPDKLWSVFEMEKTGGEPDVVEFGKSGEIVFCDCSEQTPDRRSLCYDEKALRDRKEHKPKNSAAGLAKTMGIELLNEEEYRRLQKLGEYDTKTSSWIKTPDEVRKLGGALFCDRRYGKVFVYHNGADSYYAGRGFRGIIKV